MEDIMSRTYPTRSSDLDQLALLAENENHRQFLKATAEKVMAITTRALRLADGRGETALPGQVAALLEEADRQAKLLDHADPAGWGAWADAWVYDARLLVAQA